MDWISGSIINISIAGLPEGCMIISHKYKYLFIEIDLTASWAIHGELIKNYNGRSILHKHATYYEFQRQASREELSYFVFATVRNPLDKIVSRYYKLKNDHREVFSSTDSLPQGIVDYSDLKKYQYIKDSGGSFNDYFQRFYKRPYSDMIDLSAGNLDFVIRYENIQDDFAILLKKLKVDQIQPLPQRNQTIGKSGEFLAHYTPGIVPQAKRVCGPFMKKWGYPIPESWGNDRLSTIDSLEYKILNNLRFVYFVHLRYSNAPIARFLRMVRAVLFR